MALRIEGDSFRPLLDGAHPSEIADNRPVLATRHFHTQPTDDERAIKKHNPDRGQGLDQEPEVCAADEFQKRLRQEGDKDPVAKDWMKGKMHVKSDQEF